MLCIAPLEQSNEKKVEQKSKESRIKQQRSIKVEAVARYLDDSRRMLNKPLKRLPVLCAHTLMQPAIHDVALGVSVEGRGHRIVNEALESSGSPAEIVAEKFAMATESIPTLETETMNNEILGETTDYPKYTTRDKEHPTATTAEVCMILLLILIFFINLITKRYARKIA